MEKIEIKNKNIKYAPLFFILANFGFAISTIESLRGINTFKDSNDMSGIFVGFIFAYLIVSSLIWLFLNLALRNLHKKDMKKTFYIWSLVMFVVQVVALVIFYGEIFI